jgi:hypothetical protein
MSECPHFLTVPAEKRYHVPLGPKGIACCIACYVTINQPDDLSVFTTLNRTFVEQQMQDARVGLWLLAEKDAEIDELRDTIEILEAGELA